jgi:biotin synthase
MSVEAVEEAACKAKGMGATRLCLGAAWRGPNDRDLDKVLEMVKVIKGQGLESCVTLGLLKEHQAQKLKEAGLDYYNHNIDTSPEFYNEVITTRDFEDRIQTLEHVRNADIKICCGGIIGMGESNEDRVKMLVFLANLPTPPESVPINQLIPIPGTPLAQVHAPDPFDFIRTIALARILMPQARVRLSAGRESMSDELQALCFFEGANSIFYGEKLLTAANPTPEKDQNLFNRLGLQGMAA